MHHTARLPRRRYIEKLSYNFTGVNYFDIRKNRPMTRILETARDITRQALPIKCVEAVFLATYLTQGLRELERIPVSFKSQVDGNVYKHIILAVKHNSKWGAVGLSRRRELYFKEMVYDSLAELFYEFKRSYERVFHTLKRVKVGLPMTHDALAGEPVCWSYLTTRCDAACEPRDYEGAQWLAATRWNRPLSPPRCNDAAAAGPSS